MKRLKTFRIVTWKLVVEDTFPDDTPLSTCIKQLSDVYLSCSRCEDPLNSFKYYLAKSATVISVTARNTEDVVGSVARNNCDLSEQHLVGDVPKLDEICKPVWLEELVTINGIKQWVATQKIKIFPWKLKHWWENHKKKHPYPFRPKMQRFRYLVCN